VVVKAGVFVIMDKVFQEYIEHKKNKLPVESWKVEAGIIAEKIYERLTTHPKSKKALQILTVRNPVALIFPSGNDGEEIIEQLDNIEELVSVRNVFVWSGSNRYALEFLIERNVLKDIGRGEFYWINERRIRKAGNNKQSRINYRFDTELLSVENALVFELVTKEISILPQIISEALQGRKLNPDEVKKTNPFDGYPKIEGVRYALNIKALTDFIGIGQPQTVAINDPLECVFDTLQLTKTGRILEDGIEAGHIDNKRKQKQGKYNFLKYLMVFQSKERNHDIISLEEDIKKEIGNKDLVAMYSKINTENLQNTHYKICKYGTGYMLVYSPAKKLS